MTISEESNAAQSGSTKLEKSLDAVASLRKAMELRLAQAKAEAEHQARLAAEITATPSTPPAPAATTVEPPPIVEATQAIGVELTPRGQDAQTPGEHPNPFFAPGLPVVEASTTATDAPVTANHTPFAAQDATLQLIPCAGGSCDPDMKINPFFEPSLPIMGAPEEPQVTQEKPQAAQPAEEKVIPLVPRASGGHDHSVPANPFYVPGLPTVPAYEPPPVATPTASAPTVSAPPPAPEPVASTSPAVEIPVAQTKPAPQPHTMTETPAAPKPEVKAEAKPAESKPAKAEKAKPAEDPAAEQPLNFDPIEWSRIMYNVTTKCQHLYVEHTDRMRGRPSKALSFSPEPIVQAMGELVTKVISNPTAIVETQMAMWQHYFDICQSTAKRMQDFITGAPLPPMPKVADKRFQAKEWHVNWLFDLMRQTYQTTSEEMFRLIKAETSNVENKTAQKIEFFTRLMLDATSPSNFWMTNPEVLRETWSTRGENLVKGFSRYLEDVERGNGILRMRMSDYQAFQLGHNLAATPGKVVFQNELMQLIQYAPSTPTVKSVPVLVMPPWINKFYILDLKDKNSYVRYMVNQGLTVFLISWRNPGKEQANVQFEDYISHGSLTAMREIRRITGEKRINTVAYCVGGTMQASTLAVLAKMKDNYPADLPKIESATFLTSLVDFAQPGDLGVFIDEEQISMLERRMEKQGYFDACSLMMTFNLLRSKELFWPFFVNNYLMGREPFPFDILYWNTDSTNLPAAMHSYYLRNMYLHNRLVKPDALTMLGVPVNLRDIETPCYFLSTREDHIAPWKSTYAATQLFKGPLTFVLAGSGHIAGVVNPPAAQKYNYWTNTQLPADPEEWLQGAEEHPGSWWTHWTAWLDQYGSYTVPAREVTEGIEDAPGSYVRAVAI